MTTNRMGLEQTLSDEQVKELITELELCGIYGRQVRALAELQKFRKASKEADGDDNFYSWFSREWEQYYQPNQYTTSAKQHLGAIAESAWFACRAVMLKSVTNEP